MLRHWNYRKGSPEGLKPDTSKSKEDKRQEGEKKKTMIREKEGKIEYK